MARPKRKIVAKDYDSLIQNSQDKINKLTLDLKEERLKLKDLEKEKTAYEMQLEEERKQQELIEIAKLIQTSGKTFEDVKKFLSSTNKIK